MIIINESEIKERIAKELNLKENKENIISGLLDNISTRANIRILDMLSDKERNELFEICQLNEKEEIIDYLRGKVPNLNEIVFQAAIDTVSEFKKAL